MINVLINCDSRYPANRKIIREAVVSTLTKNGLGESFVEVSVAVVGERKMREICQKYFKDDKKHEVVSFPFEDVTNSSEGFVTPQDEILRLGDVIICWPWVLKAASEDDVMVDVEVADLVAHGVEHLIGKHHE